MLTFSRNMLLGSLVALMNSRWRYQFFQWSITRDSLVVGDYVLAYTRCRVEHGILKILKPGPSQIDKLPQVLVAAFRQQQHNHLLPKSSISQDEQKRPDQPSSPLHSQRKHACISFASRILTSTGLRARPGRDISLPRRSLRSPRPPQLPPRKSLCTPERHQDTNTPC
jgi:hypothetical protein